MLLKINPLFPEEPLKLFREVGEIVDPTKVILTLCRMIFKNHLFHKMTEMNISVLTFFHFKKRQDLRSVATHSCHENVPSSPFSITSGS